MAYETEDHETQYCFPHINSSCIKGQRSRYEYYIMYVLVSLLSAWTVFLNLLVIISISHFKKLHTPTNMIILSLAVADMLVGLVMPVEASRLIETCWYFGEMLCKLYMIILGIVLSSSLSNLVLIAVDRYVAVCHPLLYPQKITITNTLLSICLCWFCYSIYNIGYVVFSSRHFKISNQTFCYGQCIIVITPARTFIDLIFTFILPCTVIITAYLRIFYVVHRQVKVINALVKVGKSETEGSVKRKSESKAALTLGIIVTVYLLCWIPFYICSLIEMTSISSAVMLFLMWSLYVTSGLNPIIYALFYRWFKISVKHILTLKIFQPESSLMEMFTDCH